MKKHQIKLSEMKISISKMKNSLARFKRKGIEEKISELEDIAIGTIYGESELGGKKIIAEPQLPAGQKQEVYRGQLAF